MTVERESFFLQAAIRARNRPLPPPIRAQSWREPRCAGERHVHRSSYCSLVEWVDPKFQAHSSPNIRLEVGKLARAVEFKGIARMGKRDADNPLYGSGTF